MRRMGDDLLIRRFDSAVDSISELTALLHRAYAGLAALGLRYVATWQDEEVTARRIDGAECWVAERDGRIIATVTFRDHSQPNDKAWYDRPDVAYFSQFGVEPDLQRGGVGSRLLDRIEARAKELGAAELALDTAVPATHLIRWYASRGYREVGRESWDMTNYESVILSLRLAE